MGGAAIFVVAGLTYVLWPTAPKVVPKPAPTAKVTVAAKPIASIEDSEQKDSAPAPPSKETPIADNDPYAVDHSKKNQIAASKATQEAPPTPTTAANKSETPSPVKVAVASPPPSPVERPDAAPSAQKPEHVLKFDPLDFDPEHLSLSSTQSATLNIPPLVASTNSIPTGPDSAPPADNEKPPEPADLLPPPVANQPVCVQRGPAVADEPQPLDTAQHLALKLNSLQLNEMPISRFVDTLAEMAGAPITLDPIALERNGQSARSIVSVNVANVTLEKALQSELARQRLELVEQDGHVSVELANRDEWRAVDFNMKDLVGDSDAAPIAKLIERFVAPESWKTNGGKGTIHVDGSTLRIEQSLAVRREALIFCERLRLARSRPQRSKYPANLLTVESPYETLAPKLNQSTTFTLMAWTRLADVVRQWQELSGLAILVDWSALSDINLLPSSPIACSTIARPWSEALDGVLEPLGLGWWAVDGQTMQITSLDALPHIQRVEFYSVPRKLREQFSTSSALVESLQKEIGNRPNKPRNPDDVRIELDEPSGRLIVRATPDVQRFLTRRLHDDLAR